MSTIKQGEVFEHEFQFTQEQVAEFAKVTGDNNPVHLDAEYAAGTKFKKPIVHGMLGAAVFSRVFGTMFPGEGTIYLGQTLDFKRPMLVDTDYVAVFEVLEVDEAKHTATVKAEIKTTGARQKVLMDGTAKLLNELRF
ncbi:hypothetical protein FUAX_21360 [Fulvitalea axinellae]|uniref:MaoC-like domain-containing protein n=1 Tax=Fulvitalea axinellae TaxID=1182444 RepID=A0AAU9CC63_9BACT|nr:hypothetical protein FUAX_21360 [Fulvitalea axinellae]